VFRFVPSWGSICREGVGRVSVALCVSLVAGRRIYSCTFGQCARVYSLDTSITVHNIQPSSIEATEDVPGVLSHIRCCIASFPRSADHQYLRVNMCTIATEQTSQWLMVDPWEAFQSYQRTAVVLDHFDHEINTVLGGAQLPSSDERRHIRVVLLAGSDLISTMSEPGVWSETDVSDIPPPVGDLRVRVRVLTSRARLVRPHPRKVRHANRRACRLGYGYGYCNGGACTLASQYLSHAAAHPE
jgi:hypothetical protein